MPKMHYQPSLVGSYKSDKMRALAREFWNLLHHFKESRKPRERFVRESDGAYLCHRFVPDVGSIALLEDSEFGESDVYDAMNVMSIRQALTLMPRNYPWLTPSSREGEADQVIQAIQDHQIFMHRKARTRRNVQRHLKQKNVRGRSAIYWEWQEEVVWRRMTDRAENAVALKKWLKQMGMTKKEAGKLMNGRYPHVISSGPVIFPIDWYDLWIDPAADLPNRRKPTKFIRRFRMLQDLMDEVDNNTDEPLYDREIVSSLREFSLQELYSSTDHAGDRAASQRMFGTAPTGDAPGIKYVPVYILHVPVYKFNYQGSKEVYVDTYFHLAESKDGGPVIIHAEENPSDLGHSHILIDDCIDWFTPWASGGLGMVEKQVSRYNQKNLLQLLTITRAVHEVFPAYLEYMGAFADDEEISLLPGVGNKVQENPLGLDVIKAMPSAQGGVMLGEQLLRFYADDLRAGMGVDGLTTDNPARSLSKAKTATEINRDMSSGSLYLDNQAENDAELLTDLCQAIFEESQKQLIPDREGMLDYERYLGSKIIQGRLAFKDFIAPRSIQVGGVAGAANREQQMQNLLQGLDIASRAMAAGFMPAAAFMQVAFIATWKKLDIPMPEGMDTAPNTISGLAEQQMSLPAPPPEGALNGAIQPEGPQVPPGIPLEGPPIPAA